MLTIEEIAEIVGKYIISNNSTVRSTAKVFKLSKSTVHRYVHDVLFKCNRVLYEEVHTVLANNFAEKYKRGGESNRLRYLKKRGERNDS
jgi:putative DeoR family transcriptional regulator (stage III sporulation protein D)